MPTLDPDALLALLRDPHQESQEIAARAGVPREEAGRATRLLLQLSKAKPEEVLTLPGPLAAALARAALAAARVDLLTALAGHAEKDVAKEAKRCLHVLRTRGMAVPELARAAPPPPPPGPAEAPMASLASALDGGGERAVWHVRSVPGKGVEVGQAVLSDTRGLVSLSVGLASRKEWRAYGKGLLERAPTAGVVEVPRERVHAWIAEARALNDTAGQRVPDGSDLWLQQLGPAPAAPMPGAGLTPLPEAEEREALAASAALHELPAFRSWIAEEDALRRLAAKLDEIQVSPLYLDERQRAAQADRTVADAVEEYLDPARRAQLSRRLLAMADHLAGLDAPAAARAAAAARALAAGTPGHAIPFARLLIERAFQRKGPAPDPQAAPQATPSGLIVER